MEPTLSDQAKIIHYQYTDRSGQAYTNTFFNDGYGGQVYEVGQELFRIQDGSRKNTA